MKKILVIILVLTSQMSFSQDTVRSDKPSDNVIEKIQNDIKEIRRDQLNYQIEKDLLKEVYSSNYSTVQLIISLILGIFAILGYVGVRNINIIKKDYDKELAELKNIKNNFERKLSEVTESQSLVKSQIESIGLVNEEQNQKIRIMELKEKVNTLVTQKDYSRALEYITIGLEMKRDDLELLLEKSRIYAIFGDFPEAVEALTEMIKIEPNNKVAITNLAELYLLVGQFDNFEQLIKEKQIYFKSDSDSLLYYFNSIKHYLKGEYDELKKIISEFVKENEHNDNKNLIGNWSYNELNTALRKEPDSDEKTLLIDFCNFLKNGNLSDKLIDLTK